MTFAVIDKTSSGLLARALMPMQGDVESHDSWLSFFIKAEKPDVLPNTTCAL